MTLLKNYSITYKGGRGKNFMEVDTIIEAENKKDAVSKLEKLCNFNPLIKSIEIL